MAKYYLISQDKKEQNDREKVYIGLVVKAPHFIWSSSSVSFKQLNPDQKEKNEEKYLHIFTMQEENKEKFFEIAEKIANGKNEEEGSLIIEGKFDSSNLPRFIEQLKKSIFTNDELAVQKGVSNPVLAQTQAVLRLSFHTIALTEQEIGQAVIVVNFKDSINKSRRKIVYIAEKNGKLVVNSSNNRDFRGIKNVLLAFYIKEGEKNNFEKILKTNFFGKNINEIEPALYSPIKETSANLVARLNPLLKELQANSSLENFVYYPNHKAVEKAYDVKTGNPIISSPQPSRNRLSAASTTFRRYKSAVSLTDPQLPNSIIIRHEPVNSNADQTSQALQVLVDRLSKFEGFRAIKSLIETIKTSKGKGSLASLTQEADNLIKKIEDEKETASDALQKLENWLHKQEQTELKDKLGQILSSLNPATQRFNEKFNSESFSFQEFVKACQTLKFIASILKSYFKAKTNNLDLKFNYEQCKEEVVGGIEAVFSGITKADTGFGSIPKIVNEILTQDSLINQFAAYNLQFDHEIKNLDNHKNERNGMVTALISVEDPRVSNLIEKIDSTLVMWEKELYAFEPVSETGHLKSLDSLNQTTDRYKKSFEEKFEKLGMLNKELLKERKNLLLTKLKQLKSQLESFSENAALASERKRLLNSVIGLVNTLSEKKLTDKEELLSFEEAYQSLDKSFGQLNQGLVKRSALYTFYGENLSDILKDVVNKSDKLKIAGKEMDTSQATIKGNVLSTINQQVSEIGNSLGSASKEALANKIREVNSYIDKHHAEITAYRSKCFSSFFFGKLLGQNLASRVDSTKLVDTLCKKLTGLDDQVQNLSR